MIDESKRESFWSLVAIASENECWDIKFNLSSAQYHMRHLGLGNIPHRIAYVLTYGEIGKKDKVKQVCSNPRCCNPRHLKIDNETDVRFWSKVDKTPGHGPWGDCWLWTSTLTVKGYGQFKLSAKRGNVAAHRFAVFLARGEDHSDLFLLHACDMPACVNPSHLEWGTQSRNIRDAISRGRFNPPGFKPKPQKGSLNNQAKLTERDVIEIRALLDQSFTLKTIADQYGVNFTTISAIKRRKIWNHI